jgi:hypothetical protein
MYVNIVSVTCVVLGWVLLVDVGLCRVVFGLLMLGCVQLFWFVLN